MTEYHLHDIDTALKDQLDALIEPVVRQALDEFGLEIDGLWYGDFVNRITDAVVRSLPLGCPTNHTSPSGARWNEWYPEVLDSRKNAFAFCPDCGQRLEGATP